VLEGELPEGGMFVGKPYSPDAIVSQIRLLVAA
jgi:hypothetical protein